MSMNTTLDTISNHLTNHDTKVLNKLRELSLAAINTNLEPENITFLSIATTSGFLEAVEVLLEFGADSNGKTLDGIGLSTPISRINPNQNFKGILNCLLLHGADINATGTDERTLLFNVLTGRVRCKYNKVFYTLSRGANPNMTRDNLPLRAAFKIRGNLGEKIINLLLYFGANPRKKTIKGIPVGDVAPPSKRFVNESLESTLKKHENTFLFMRIVKAFKIPMEGKDFSKEEVRREMRDSIYYIRDHQNEIDFEDIKYRRAKMRKGNYSNEYTSAFVDTVNEFTDTEIIVYKEIYKDLSSSEYRSWCFHVSEIPFLLKTGKNPWTQKPFMEEFLEKMLKNHNLTVSITLREALDMFISKEEDKGRGLDEKLAILEKYINSHNVYTDLNELRKLPPPELVSIMAILVEQGIFINEWKKRRKERKTQYQTRLITEIVDALMRAIQTRKISIPMATYTLEQVIDDYNIVQQIVNTVDNVEVVTGKDFDTLLIVLGKEKTKEIERILQAKVGSNNSTVRTYWRDLFPAMRRYVRANKKGSITN